jgi:transcriptional regulator with PAS, ATPase and Fis domain
MTTHGAQRLVGSSPAVRAMEQEVACAARSDAKVLIVGESGVGKELTARLIHEQSARRQGPFLAINCAALPETLLESELFGHARGSFTGAYRDQPGMLEAAHGGTILLDEIGEMSLRMQGMLLRFLETGEIQRVGALRASAPVDARILAATNRNLAQRIEEQGFREDLFYRLNVIHIVVPPLRDRREDVPELLASFLATYAERYRVEVPHLSPEAMARLMAYHWPGNVRELRNVAERLTVRARTEVITPDDLPSEIRSRTQVVEPPEARPTRASETLYERMVRGRECFWSVVYDPFMLHDVTRHEVRQVVRRGLQETRGNYSLLVRLFNMSPGDHKRFLGFLHKHECHRRSSAST